MSMTPSKPLRTGLGIAASSLSMLLLPCLLVYAGTEIREQRAADPQGSVEIVDLAGSIEVSGWDRPQVEVTGTTGDSDGRVDVTTTGSRTIIHVGTRYVRGWGGGDDTRLVIHVPAKSAVSATLVSANLKVDGLQGDANLRTVSGNISGEVGGNLRANTVNGAIRMTARGAKMVEVRTINGEVHLAGGGGEVELTTVSGNAKIELGTLTRGRFKSISGNVSANLSLAPDAELEGESVSGNIHLNFPSAPAADFDVQSFSGSIENCFGPKPSEARYGPGSRLEFKTGDAHARVRVETKSGDVRLCTGDMRREPVSAPVVRARPWTDILYVM
jgi:Putative adhesin